MVVHQLADVLDELLADELGVGRVVRRDRHVLQRKERVPCRTLKFENIYSTEMCSGSEAGSYLRRIELLVRQVMSQG